LPASSLPARLLRYLRQAAADTTVGHNPLGALSVLAMLLVLGLQVGTGCSATMKLPLPDR
jgi:cytochrome b